MKNNEIISRIPNNNKMDYILIETHLITVDRTYQRGVSEVKIKKYIKNFNMNAFGTLMLNKRNGDDNYYLIDGQHRLITAERKSMKLVPCCVIYGLTQKEEAELFVELNSNRYQVKAMEKVKAKITAEDKNVLEIIEIMNKYGFKPNNLNKGNETMRRKGYITNVPTLEKIYTSKGSTYVEIVLKIISSAWGRKDGTFDADALKRDTIEGMYHFVSKCYNDIDEKRLINKLKNTPAIQLLQEQNKNQSIFKKGKPSNYARAVLEVYNSKTSFKLTNVQF